MPNDSTDRATLARGLPISPPDEDGPDPDTLTPKIIALCHELGYPSKGAKWAKLGGQWVLSVRVPERNMPQHIGFGEPVGVRVELPPAHWSPVVKLRAIAATRIRADVWSVEVLYEGTVYPVTVAREGRIIRAATHPHAVVSGCARDAVAREQVYTPDVVCAGISRMGAGAALDAAREAWVAEPGEVLADVAAK
jgi:hypothetical protein